MRIGADHEGCDWKAAGGSASNKYLSHKRTVGISQRKGKKAGKRTESAGADSMMRARGRDNTQPDRGKLSVRRKVEIAQPPIVRSGYSPASKYLLLTELSQGLDEYCYRVFRTLQGTLYCT